jgi:hypothetical protein
VERAALAAFIALALGGFALPARAQKHEHGKAKPAAATQAKPPPKGHPATTKEEPKGAPASAPAEAGEAPKPEPSSAHEVVERESHIEFDERMVRGQSAAGAIYLFRRTPSEFKSIVQVPESFRDRTTALVATPKEAP